MQTKPERSARGIGREAATEKKCKTELGTRQAAGEADRRTRKKRPAREGRNDRGGSRGSEEKPSNEERRKKTEQQGEERAKG